MEISVFVRGQNPATDTAPHRGTRTVVKMVLAGRFANSVGQNAIQLVSDAPWKEVKRAARLRMNGVHVIPGGRKVYQHHIEPRLERLSIGDSAWLRYMEYGVQA